MSRPLQKWAVQFSVLLPGLIKICDRDQQAFYCCPQLFECNQNGKLVSQIQKINIILEKKWRE